MAKHNSVIFSGRVARPEFKLFDSGNKKFMFSLAIDDSYKPEGKDWIDRTIWLDVELWGKQAEAYQTLSKGQELVIEGKLGQKDPYEKDGQKITPRPHIVPLKITICESKRSNQQCNEKNHDEDYENALKIVRNTGVSNANYGLMVMVDVNGDKIKLLDGDYAVSGIDDHLFDNSGVPF